MKDVALLLNDMLEAGVINEYAVFGAVAQMRYTEAVSTMDADILVALPNDEDLDLLGPIYKFCLKRGYKPEGEAIMVGDWPVQFIPTYSILTSAALKNAEAGDIDGTPLRVVSANYLAVIALGAGRAKDFARILAMLEIQSVQKEEIAQLAGEYELRDEWEKFESRFLND